MSEPVVSKPIADFGDNLVDAILDAVDAEPPELAARLRQAIKMGRYRAFRRKDHELVQFPDERIEYVIRFVKVDALPPRRLDA